MVDTRGKIFELTSADIWKMHLSWIFLGILEFHGSFEKLTRKIHTTFLYACLYVPKQKKKKKSFKWKIFQECFKNLKKKT